MVRLTRSNIDDLTECRLRDVRVLHCSVFRVVMVDVSKPIPYPPTPEVVEALRLRVLQVRASARQSFRERQHLTAFICVSTTQHVVRRVNSSNCNIYSSKMNYEHQKSRRQALLVSACSPPCQERRRQLPKPRDLGPPRKTRKPKQR